MKKILTAFAILLSVSATGCATLFTGSTQDVAAGHANCKAYKGSELVGAASGGSRELFVSKGSSAITVKCPDGYDKTAIASFNGITLLNLFNGLLGWIVDIATGAMWRYE